MKNIKALILKLGSPIVILAILFTSMIVPCSAFGQDKRELYRETIDDPYLPGPRDSMSKSPGYRAESTGVFTVQVNVDSNGNNIIGDAANETSIAVDPVNPNRIVMGWRQFDNVSSNFRQAGNAYSNDAGLNWTFAPNLNAGVFRSDPVLDFDIHGNFYYNSLIAGFNCDVYKITDGGNDWGTPIPAEGGDKQWMRIDRTQGGQGTGNNYSYWNQAFTGPNCPNGAFTRSTDGSNTFEDCILVDGNPQWGTLAVDKIGNLFIVGTSNTGIILVKSSDAKDPNSSVSWDSVTNIDLDGDLGVFAAVNPAGLMGQAWVDVDVSNGPGEDNVYVLASVERTSITDPGDVMFARSTNGGATFEPPVKINSDPDTDNTQWFGTMSVAPNGRIDVIWLDTRNAPSATPNFSQLFYTFSEDQGTTWSVNVAISPLFDPNIGYPNQNKMGDYFDMVSDDRYAHVGWANTLNGEQDAYYTQIDPITVLSVEGFTSTNDFNFVNYPNPFSESTTIAFSIAEATNVTVDIFDVLGNKVSTLLDDTVQGHQQISWNGTNNNGAKVNSGLYFISLETANHRVVRKVILK